MFFFFQAEDGIRDAQESRGLGDVYKRQIEDNSEKTNESLNVLDIAGQLPLEIEEKFNFLILNCPIKRETFLLNKIKFLHMINQKLEQLGYRFFLN